MDQTSNNLRTLLWPGPLTRPEQKTGCYEPELSLLPDMLGPLGHRPVVIIFGFGNHPEKYGRLIVKIFQVVIFILMILLFILLLILK